MGILYTCSGSVNEGRAMTVGAHWPKQVPSSAAKEEGALLPLAPTEGGGIHLRHYTTPAMGFHEDCLVLDGHTDVPTRLWESPASLEERRSDRHVDLPRLREGGVDALVFALYLPGSLNPEKGWEHARELHRV